VDGVFFRSKGDHADNFANFAQGEVGLRRAEASKIIVCRV
jgi:hypothetical protein